MWHHCWQGPLPWLGYPDDVRSQINLIPLGIAQSADMVSKYLIERAEQYQPIIEMPTGIDVEIVFLEGVFIQN